METTTLIGAAAAAASTLSFTPQAWKIIKSRDTSSISLRMYAITTAGFALWLLYGVRLGEWPLIFTNGFCFCLAAFILTMKALPQRRKEQVADALDPSA
ncbi:MAG: SemiSWEET transporter [Hyphomicrobiales bacterium]|nr:SemiSWEET transporter [Hyphomicrobiales bacterium]